MFGPPHSINVINLREDVDQWGHAGAEEGDMGQVGAHIDVVTGYVSLGIIEGDKVGMRCGWGVRLP